MVDTAKGVTEKLAGIWRNGVCAYAIFMAWER